MRQNVRLGVLGVFLGLAHMPNVIAAPVIERVTPESIPPYIEVEIEALGCDTKAIVRDYVAIWYATVKTKVANLEEGADTSIFVFLRNPLTDSLLFNPGGRTHREGGYVLRSIVFDSTILDQVVFQWRNLDSAGGKLYEIYLTDFYKGERC